MQVMICSRCNFPKPLCEYNKHNRTPYVCRRCTKGLRPKRSKHASVYTAEHRTADEVFRLERQAKKEARRAAGEFVTYPSRMSEFEVQFFLCSELRALGYVVRGEVSSTCRTCRFDLVLYYKNDSGKFKAFFIIEVKNGRPMRSRPTAQLKKYRQHGIQVKMIAGLNEAEKFIEAVKTEPLAPKEVLEPV